MKIVTGIFNPDDVVGTVNSLTQNGFGYEDLSVLSSASEMPSYLEGAAEKSAASGAVAGAVVGSTLGALGTAAASTVPGFEGVFVTGLMTTTLGGVVGGYLGSLYSVRAEEEMEEEIEFDVQDALKSGQILLVVKIEEEGEAETAVTLLEQNNGRQIEIHDIPPNVPVKEEE